MVFFELLEGKGGPEQIVESFFSTYRNGKAGLEQIVNGFFSSQ